MGGKMDKAKGHVKEKLGKATKNPRLVREGRKDRAAGEAKEGLERVKETVESGIDRARKAVTER